MQNLTLLPVFKTAMIPAKVVQRGCQPAHPAVIPALPGESQALTSLPSVPLPTGMVVPLDSTGVHLAEAKPPQGSGQFALAKDGAYFHPLHSPTPIVLLHPSAGSATVLIVKE